MKGRKVLLTLMFITNLIFFIFPVAYGNPIIPPTIKSGEIALIRILILIGMFFLGAKIEFAYFKSKILKRKVYQFNTNYRLFLKINLVTFPLTQIFAYFFYVYFFQFFWYYVFLIEIGVVFTESFLLRIEFQKLWKEATTSKFIFRTTIFANLYSFLLGLIPFIPSII